MSLRPSRSVLPVTFAVVLALAAPRARAHFPWLAVDADGRALLYFGESPADRTYHTPDAVAEAKVLFRIARAAPREIELPAVETDDLIGRRSADPIPTGGVLESEIRYGIYHGMLLDYYARHVPTTRAAAIAGSGLKLAATPRVAADGVELAVLWDGQPLAGATVTLIDPAGVPTEAETDEAGVARFAAPAAGLLGFLIARTDNEAQGELDGEKYTSSAAYGTVTFNFQPAPAAKNGAAPAADDSAALPALPEAVSSFGAAVADGYLYVYGGHIGEEHAHSRDNLSQHFRRIALTGDAAWEELPMQTPLQGLPLVTHGGKLYRVGGLNFRNAAADDPDMHSVAEFASYDPATRQWTALPSLPEARSSHDAVVIGDALYVVGGWTLAGEDEGSWLDTAWSFNLADPQAQWQAVVSPPFKCRALAVAAWNGQLVAIGGMDENRKLSRRAVALDLASGQWTELARLPRSAMAGFGVSAWNLQGKLLVSGADGVVHQLADDGKQWIKAGELATGRFFHRLMPGAAANLLVVAGASMDEGHLATIESFSPGASN